jgi:hypothetical protein
MIPFSVVFVSVIFLLADPHLQIVMVCEHRTRQCGCQWLRCYAEESWVLITFVLFLLGSSFVVAAAA